MYKDILENPVMTKEAMASQGFSGGRSAKIVIFQSFPK
jgi:hypothetical protein